MSIESEINEDAEQMQETFSATARRLWYAAVPDSAAGRLAEFNKKEKRSGDRPVPQSLPEDRERHLDTAAHPLETRTLSCCGKL